MMYIRVDSQLEEKKKKEEEEKKKMHGGSATRWAKKGHGQEHSSPTPTQVASELKAWFRSMHEEGSTLSGFAAGRVPMRGQMKILRIMIRGEGEKPRAGEGCGAACARLCEAAQPVFVETITTSTTGRSGGAERCQSKLDSFSSQ